jgi:hypothetical protein
MDRKEYQKIYYKKNKDKKQIKAQKNKENKKQYDKIYREINKKTIQKYREDHKDQKKKNDNKYYKINKEKILYHHRQHYNKCKQSIRDNFKRLINNWKGKRGDYEKILGYTLESLKAHLSKFGDINNKILHIDHILPIAFLKKYIQDEQLLLKIAHDPRNLMLLSKKDNSSKRDKLTIEYIPDFHMYDFFEYICELIEYKQTLENKI